MYIYKVLLKFQVQLDYDQIHELFHLVLRKTHEHSLEYIEHIYQYLNLVFYSHLKLKLDEILPD